MMSTLKNTGSGSDRVRRRRRSHHYDGEETLLSGRPFKRKFVSPEATGANTSAVSQESITNSESSSNSGSDSAQRINRLYIRQLELKGFRTFKDTVVTFHHGLNLLAGQNGAGKSSLLKAIEFALSAMHRSFKRSPLYKAGVLKSQDVSTKKSQRPVVLKIVFAGAKPAPAGFPRCPVEGEHHVSLDARFTKASKLKCNFKFNEKNVTFDQLNECLRAIGITTETVQFIRQDQSFASDEFDSATLMEQFNGILERGSMQHFQTWVPEIRRSIPESLDRAARTSERAERLLRQLKEASKARAQYLALKKQKRKLELRLNGQDLRVLRNQIVRLQSELEETIKPFWQAVQKQEQSIQQLEKLQRQMNSEKLRKRERDEVQEQLTQLQSRLTTLNSLLRDKLAYRKATQAGMTEWQQVDKKIRTLEAEAIRAERDLQHAQLKVRDREMIIVNLTARKNALVRLLTRRNPREQHEHEIAEEERLTVEINELQQEILNCRADVDHFKQLFESNAREFEQADAELQRIHEQLKRCMRTESRLREAPNLMLEEYEYVVREAVERSRNRTSAELADAREKFVMAVGPSANVHFHIKDICRQLYSSNDTDNFCIPVLDLISVDPVHRRAVSVADKFLRSFVVPTGAIAKRLLDLLTNFDINHEDVRLITLDSYDQKRTERSRMASLQAKPLVDCVQLISHENLTNRRLDQIRQMIASELRHFWLLDSNLYHVEHIEDVLELFDNRLYSKLTFVNENGDVITRHGIKIGQYSTSCDVITAYEHFRLCNETEKEYRNETTRIGDTMKRLDTARQAALSKLVTEENTMTELRSQYMANFYEKYVAERQLRYSSEALMRYRKAMEESEAQLHIRDRYLQEKRRFTDEAAEEHLSPEYRHHELGRVVDELRHLQADLVSEKEKRGSIHGELTSLRTSIAELHHQSIRLYDEWLEFPEILFARASYEVNGIQQEIRTTRRQLSEYQAKVAGLSQLVGDVDEGQLAEAGDSVDIETARVTKIDRQMNCLRASLTELRGQYSYLGGGDPDNVADADVDEADSENESSEAELRRQLDRVRKQLSEMPEGLSLLNERLPEMFMEKMRLYRDFHGDLRYVSEIGLDEIEAKLMATRRAIERTAVVEIERQMQTAFVAIVPQGEVVLTPKYRHEGDDDSEGDLISLQVQARFGSSEPLRGADMFSGGQRAIMSMVLMSARSRIHAQKVLLLDEVDAALDELHCGKYAELLKKLSRNTQVIFTSHRIDPDKFVAADRVHNVILHHGAVFVESRNPAGSP